MFEKTLSVLVPTQAPYEVKQLLGLGLEYYRYYAAVKGAVVIYGQCE